MKRSYQAPEILFDDFSLCTSVAANCEVINNNPTSGVCGFVYKPFVVFTLEVTGCKKKIAEGSINDGLCYHNPYDGYNLFNS